MIAPRVVGVTLDRVQPARRVLTAEIVIVLLLSLGQSAVYAVVSLIAKLTAGKALSQQAAVLNASQSPRPYLDLALETWPAYIPHGLSKTVVVQMTRSLAKTLAPAVRVNAVAPGVIMLPEGWQEDVGERLRKTTPLKRLGSANDVAGAVIYLLEADYVTGETIVVDGGRHVRR